MTEEAGVENAMSLNPFDTAEEARAFRKKLRYPELYGIYGLYQSKEKQLWVTMPLTVLTALFDFKETT
jgi:hypothetical protein